MIPQCLDCAWCNLQKRCLAFPDGIPEEIWIGHILHDHPIEGDNDFIFHSAIRNPISNLWKKSGALSQKPKGPSFEDRLLESYERIESEGVEDTESGEYSEETSAEESTSELGTDEDILEEKNISKTSENKEAGEVKLNLFNILRHHCVSQNYDWVRRAFEKTQIFSSEIHKSKDKGTKGGKKGNPCHHERTGRFCPPGSEGCFCIGKRGIGQIDSKTGKFVPATASVLMRLMLNSKSSKLREAALEQLKRMAGESSTMILTTDGQITHELADDKRKMALLINPKKGIIEPLSDDAEKIITFAAAITVIPKAPSNKFITNTFNLLAAQLAKVNIARLPDTIIRNLANNPYIDKNESAKRVALMVSDEAQYRQDANPLYGINIEEREVEIKGKKQKVQYIQDSYRNRVLLARAAGLKQTPRNPATLSLGEIPAVAAQQFVFDLSHINKTLHARGIASDYSFELLPGEQFMSIKPSIFDKPGTIGINRERALEWASLDYLKVEHVIKFLRASFRDAKNILLNKQTMPQFRDRINAFKKQLVKNYRIHMQGAMPYQWKKGMDERQKAPFAALYAAPQNRLKMLIRHSVGHYLFEKLTPKKKDYLLKAIEGKELFCASSYPQTVQDRETAIKEWFAENFVLMQAKPSLVDDTFKQIFDEFYPLKEGEEELSETDIAPQEQEQEQEEDTESEEL